MNKFYFCFFLFIFLTVQSQSPKTAYEKKVDEINTKAFKSIGVSESLISQARKNNDWKIVLNSNEFFNISRYKDREVLKQWYIFYSAAMKEAEKLKNSEDLAKDKSKIIEQENIEKQKKINEELAQKERKFQNSDYSFIKQEVTKKLENWTAKGEFEKMEDWKKRIYTQTDSIFLKFCNEEFQKKIKFSLNLGQYNSETETFPYKLEKNRENIFVKGFVQVPISLAQNFKYTAHNHLNFESGIKWKFVEYNLFPTEFTNDDSENKYKFIVESDDSDKNPTISLSELQYKDKPEITSVFDFNKENKTKYEVNKKELNEKITTELNQGADFPGGISRLRIIFANNMDLSSIEGDVKGTVTTKLNFIIDGNGELKNIEAVGNNKAFNDEAIRTIKSINIKWLPAKKDGIAVESPFSFPMSATFE